MSVIQSIKSIYKGPFTQYLRASEQIGDEVYEQSKLVDILFILEINFLSIVHKYKKPIYEQDQNIFIKPIVTQLRRLRRMRDNHLSSPYITHLTIVNETVKIFEWIKQDNVEELIEQIKSNITPHLSKLKNELLKLDTKHIRWVYFWNVWWDSMSEYFINFYKDGLTWGGTEELPTYLLGDIPEMYRKMEHVKLFQEINRGEDIIRILRQTRANNDEVEEQR